jgi:hypothetical protein
MAVTEELAVVAVAERQEGLVLAEMEGLVLAEV